MTNTQLNDQIGCKINGTSDLGKIQSMDRDIELALESYDVKKVKSLLETYIRRVIVHPAVETDLKEKHYHLMSLFIAYVQKKEWYAHKVLDLTRFAHAPCGSEAVQQLISCYLTMSEDIICYSQKTTASQHPLIVKTILYVNKNVKDDISLTSVAEHVYVNPSYLSRLFKKEVGISFSSYLNKKKMDLARYYILKGYTVSKAAHILSFKDVSYFTKVFRKHWGILPRELINIGKSRGSKP